MKSKRFVPMGRLRENAQSAKRMLGESGTLDRVAALADVHCEGPDEWVVASLDSSGDGGIYVTTFTGPDAQARAMEYASEKYSGFRLRT